MNNLSPKVDFKATQAQFSAYIRNPVDNPCPDDVKPERMKVYQELFFNNVEGFLSSNFPVLHTVLSPENWQQLAQDFFQQHQCESPYFTEIPEEFMLYLQNERAANEFDYPFMLELAHYEWVEMALSISTDCLPEKRTITPLRLEDSISLSSLAWPLAYQFPVHKISPDYLPLRSTEQISYIVVYRNAEDEVNFIELAPMSFQLLQGLQEQDAINVGEYLDALLADNYSVALEQAALSALQQFADKEIVLSI